MNFTREPIIETVITPREGCKLVVKSSKSSAQEEYLVDAVEVVSFGNSLFFRSQERPKSFLVPVSDYEVLESKESRIVLKNTNADQAIKIGGGRDAPPPPRRESHPEDATLSDSRPAPEGRQQDRKREGGRRRRGRRGRDRHQDMPQERSGDQPRTDNAPQGSHDDEPRHEPWHEHDHANHDHEQGEDGQNSEQNQGSEQNERREPHHRERRHEHPRHAEGAAPQQRESFPEEKPSFISKLFPPPANLVNKESLSRFKPAESDEKPIEPDAQDDDEE